MDLDRLNGLERKYILLCFSPQEKNTNLFIFKSLFLIVCVCSACGGQKRALGLLKLEIRLVVNGAINRTHTSVRAADNLQHCAIFSATRH